MKTRTLDLSHSLDPTTLRRLKELSHICAGLKLTPYLVGGIVRDLLLSKPVREDLDVTVCGGNVRPLAEKLAETWHAKLHIHNEFLTFRLDLKDGSHLDLVTARKEIYSHPGSLPTVRPGTLETDISRRDFKINAIACSLSGANWGECVDLAGGIADLKKKQLTILHELSFTDDPTRIFRAARFAARLKFKLEPSTQRLVQKTVKSSALQTISKDRVRAELEKILVEQNAHAPLKLLSNWEVLKEIHPDIPAPPLALSNSFTADKNTILIVRVSLWLASVPTESPEILSLLNFPSEQQDKVMEAVILHHDLISKSLVTDFPQKNPCPESIIFIKLLSAQNRHLKTRWTDYRQWLKSRPLINGADLKKLGIAPGPEYKQIFRQIALARYEGKLITKTQEIKFVSKL